MGIRRQTVWGMVWLRVALCPALLWGTRAGWAGPALAGIVLLALLDDIFDGILARRWNCETSTLRLADSCSDTVFYLGVAVALWMRNPAILRANKLALGVLFGLEGLRYGFDLWKFAKAASYHSYLAKLWGLVLAVAVIGVLGWGGLGWMIRVALWFGVVVNLEGLAMSLLLRQWQNDVKTLAAAWRLRKKQQTG